MTGPVNVINGLQVINATMPGVWIPSLVGWLTLIRRGYKDAREGGGGVGGLEPV